MLLWQALVGSALGTLDPGLAAPAKRQTNMGTSLLVLTQWGKDCEAFIYYLVSTQSREATVSIKIYQELPFCLALCSGFFIQYFILV